MTEPTGRPPPALSALIADPPRGEQASVTDVNGTVARFEMAYTPPDLEARYAFGAPARGRLPAYLYLAASTLLAGIVTFGYLAPSNSRAYVWVVEGDRGRPLSAAVLVSVVLASALATVARAHMLGVVVRGDGIDARSLLPLGLPRIRRWVWPQVHRIVVSGHDVALELWDGAYEHLPRVAEPTRLADLLVAIARARGIQVTRLG